MCGNDALPKKIFARNLKKFICVVNRMFAYDLKDLLQRASSPDKVIFLEDREAPVISSTEIREKVRSNQNIESFVGAEVAEYIRKLKITFSIPGSTLE